jgi:hypothetical protein
VAILGNLFAKKSPYMTLFSGQSGTYLRTLELHVLVAGLLTNAALVIAYQSKKDKCEKIYVASLKSGTIKDEQTALENIKDDAESISNCIYWAGGATLDIYYQDEIKKINDILGVTSISKVDGGNIIVDLNKMTVSSTHHPEIKLQLDNTATSSNIAAPNFRS